MESYKPIDITRSMATIVMPFLNAEGRRIMDVAGKVVFTNFSSNLLKLLKDKNREGTYRDFDRTIDPDVVTCIIASRNCDQLSNFNQYFSGLSACDVEGKMPLVQQEVLALQHCMGHLIDYGFKSYQAQVRAPSSILNSHRRPLNSCFNNVKWEVLMLAHYFINLEIANKEERQNRLIDLCGPNPTGIEALIMNAWNSAPS